MFSNLIVGASEAYLGDSLFVLVVFIILVALVGKFAFGPVSKMMQARSDKITNDLDNAAQSREDAAKLAAQRATELKNSKSEAVEIVNTAKQNGEKQREGMVTLAQEEVQTLKQNAKKDIEQARLDALNSARDDVAQLSIEIASKLIKKELSVTDQKSLINSYIEGLDKQNETR
ncbi:F0F1 ATP synthase subunit B [Latilactobacillus curvatus]|uniref:ATP synthase subunit b n=1 Tax=Latilactobacillus curvatus TaxID=28038 RepID=A0A385ADT0_LATCU|nr:F0F1 ATP synthase subunit B [Latilactobacillus curvatus]AXN35718.1 ATP synthase F0 subunit B [Latilactobacillus curvatus]EHE86634.1 ATP synthase F0, B subunit [Latilactobacillus curvatus CRL 705]MCM6843771.1 F0F1 ATP synthase subunit B [Latilactobacillus curvatus]MCM6861343.1 F0F1 ATP synthase subunit B [Latilactobacillus curvatus]MCM6868642.1 F0F1 ATP synthase subunit B [Latilactobacillus curvatus]